ncbi:MAG TPA: hypothetical protein PLB26_17325 [Rubrivivax sp.]|nr:hypothetical protein [Rubrivivax sp.]
MDTSSEEHRHRCEVRAVLAWRVQHGQEWAQDWLDGVAARRGAAAAQRLREDCRAQWAKGNRGEPGDWR